MVWGHLTASVVRDSDGNPEFTVGMVHDVSDRKQLEERLYQAQKLDAVGRLAGGVAHDFNNLLTVITVHSGFLRGSLDPHQVGLRADVEAIEQAAERAASLTQQLLAFGRKQVLQPRIVDLNSIVVDTNKMLHRLIGEHIEVVTALGSDLWDVQADPGQVEQVLVNLALNARDAMAGGGTLTIRTANVDAGAGADGRGRGAVRRPLRRRLRLWNGCRDAGEDLRAVLHDQSERRNGARARECLRDRRAERRLHRRHKRAGRGHDDGCLPAARRARACRARRLRWPLPVRATAARPSCSPRTRTACVTAARRILAAQGYTVLEAFDGAEALTLAAGHSGTIDLLLTDVVMPRKTGPQVAAELLAQRPELKVLYMSGHADEAIMPLALAGTDTAFVQKPFTHDRLAAAVRELLDREREPLGRAVGASPHR